eukprot:CAMPEP_0170074826 /NCGR_PEP_ID=MMETSP0019_2-20121128/12069_1 /TAXON_ID=98059 /ORGANISM="Dinobryon sp., Strain UTEXLB2267" /LENGTH=39 /DNA_ID= /DNA_START= /DNA_END= /DNA_ORIENTATION=
MALVLFSWYSAAKSRGATYGMAVGISGNVLGSSKPMGYG